MNNDAIEELLIRYDRASDYGLVDEFFDNPDRSVDEIERIKSLRDCIDRLEGYWCAKRDDESAASSPKSFQRFEEQQAEKSTIGRYEVTGELGRGGFGIVYLAWDPLLNRQVAIKVPRIEVVLDDRFQGWMFQEAKIAANLNHPHIVPVLEVIDFDDYCCIVSEYCPGENLAVWLTHHSLSPLEATELTMRLASALSYFHDRGIVHRDLKPGNILIVDSPSDSLSFTPKIADFGLSKPTELEFSGIPAQATTLVGTPQYMAPEQVDSLLGIVGPATDVHALGVILYELIVGKPPFSGAHPAEVLDEVRNKHVGAFPKHVADVPADLQAICLKCLRKSPGERYLSAELLSVDLRRVLGQDPIAGRNATLFE